MTSDTISPRHLSHLALCRLIARENLDYYEGVFESLSNGPDRDMIGRAMAQKQDFISAADVLLNAHESEAAQAQTSQAANDHRRTSAEDGLRHLEHEEHFKDALSECLDKTDDEALRELLSHHLDASELAVNAIKTTSLKL
jgi:hypothetical protein